MKFILISLIIVFITNVTMAKNLLDIFLEYRNINSDVSKASKPPSYVIAKRRTIGIFPSLPNRQNKFMVDLKPPIETHSPVTMSKQYKQLLMRELSMKDEHKDNDKMKAEATTRRSLMRTKKFTVRPHDVHAESFREKYNYNRNRKNIKSRKPKSENNIGETNYKTIENIGLSKRKLKTPLLFPKRNNTKYFKGNPKQHVSKRLHINNFVPKNKVPLNLVNKNNNSIIEEKENVTVPSDVFIKSHFKNQIIKPKDSLFDQDELIPVKVNDISFAEPDILSDDEITTDSDIYLVSRNKRSLNIIEEESVATTFSGIKITDQDYPIIHLTYNNIHT